MTRKLEFDSIELSFGDRNILRSIYMLCQTGTITGLLGRNGSGKTTLMKVVFGAVRSEHKSVRIDGRSIGVSYLRRRLIAYLPQSDLIPNYLSMRAAYSLFNVDEKAVSELFPETSAMMHLRPPLLSGGYLRIFETILILKSQAIFCLLDEPFRGLTPLYIEKMKALITLCKNDKGIIVSDHQHRHVLEVADSLYLLTNGQTYPIKRNDQLISLGYLTHL